MKPKYRIIKTKRGMYFIQQKWLCFWRTLRPFGGPICMESFNIAANELERIKKYNASKQEVVWEG